MNHYYLRGDTIWNCKQSDSWCWRKILKTRDLVQHGFCPKTSKWWHSSAGVYSVTSSYKWLKGSKPQITWYRLIWHKHRISKCAFIMWQPFRRSYLLETDYWFLEFALIICYVFCVEKRMKSMNICSFLFSSPKQSHSKFQ